jgi:uncharacterized protein (DUF697 family)/uncharacterized tellurite resistance protein B-like protein
MAITEQEAVASLHLLVAVAQADGQIHEEEKKALGAALAGIDILEGTDIESFLGEKVDLAQEASLLTSDEAREETYRSAYGMAYADGDCSSEEKATLEKLRELLKVDAERAAEIARVFSEQGASTESKSAYTKIEDPAERQAMVRRLTIKDAIMSALLGAFPVPGLAIATDLAVVAIQVNLIRDIGALWGADTDKKGAKALLATFGLGTGARLAVNNLVKVIPGWGSLVGATTSFASTYAVGLVMHKHYEKAADGNVDIEALKKEFAVAEKEGKSAYKENKDAIAKKEAEAKAKLDELNADLKAGRLSQAQYEERASLI